MLLLTQLRWLAIAGQLAAILGAWSWIGDALPIVPMLAILAALAALNLMTLSLLHKGWKVANHQLFVALLMDWAALTTQLYLSGGTTNPFAPIGLLQVVLGAVLLEAWSSWALVALHSSAFGALAAFHRPLRLPAPYASTLSPVHMLASWLNFVMVSVLLVLFVTRIARNMRIRDARLAALRQQAAEEDHIVRMGLLASGAAHELGTPLALMAVILGDWRHQPELTPLGEEIGEMQAAVARCKEIVTGILYASGEARSEMVERTSLSAFVAKVAQDWDTLRPGVLTLDDRSDGAIAIVADRTLVQVLFNLLDNAVEAGAGRIALLVEVVDDELHLTVEDDGPGFTAETLASLGKPYSSTRDRRGAGLGLFLAVNVMRKLGGAVTAANAGHGAVVTLAIPLRALAVEGAP
ncbi:HAMP domain-containing histidine kinase [Sphingomonas sp. CGMCC 1.13654]|uniref:histidine kinase n=2 Tax=Sphingomonas chungangi TaxID=2683589 RepID=A0A838LA50_9SPHN|nr:HAMP domain-containing histidine kinase [Sphingomonas chungangi]MVW58296.1 sensor histidine kinase [Sphingomonas chungangi]